MGVLYLITTSSLLFIPALRGMDRLAPQARVHGVPQSIGEQKDR